MIPANQPYEALVERPKDGGRLTTIEPSAVVAVLEGGSRHAVPVVAWSDSGEAMVAAVGTGQLVAASSVPGFTGLRRCPTRPAVVAVVPGGGWRCSFRLDDDGGWSEPEDVLGWVVYEDGVAKALVVATDRRYAYAYRAYAHALPAAFDACAEADDRVRLVPPSPAVPDSEACDAAEYFGTPCIEPGNGRLVISSDTGHAIEYCGRHEIETSAQTRGISPEQWLVAAGQQDRTDVLGFDTRLAERLADVSTEAELTEALRRLPSEAELAVTLRGLPSEADTTEALNRLL